LRYGDCSYRRCRAAGDLSGRGRWSAAGIGAMGRRRFGTGEWMTRQHWSKRIRQRSGRRAV
jgi:hypothetical protein